MERLDRACVVADRIFEFLYLCRAHADRLGKNEPAHALATGRGGQRAFIMVITPALGQHRTGVDAHIRHRLRRAIMRREVRPNFGQRRIGCAFLNQTPTTARPPWLS